MLHPFAVAAPAHAAATAALAEPDGVKPDMTIAMPLFQRVIVAVASVLACFWLPTRCYKARRSAFAFIAPRARVLFGLVQLGEPLPTSYLAAPLRVAAGIARFSARRT